MRQHFGQQITEPVPVEETREGQQPGPTADFLAGTFQTAFGPEQTVWVRAHPRAAVANSDVSMSVSLYLHRLRLKHRHGSAAKTANDANEREWDWPGTILVRVRHGHYSVTEFTLLSDCPRTRLFAFIRG